MIYQNNPSACGQTALFNALQALGVETTIEKINATLAKTGYHTGQGGAEYLGTTEHQFLRAVEKIPKIDAMPQKVQDGHVAWHSLRSQLSTGAVAMLAVDNDDHWISAIGIVGDRILLADSADTRMVVSMDQKSLLRRWSNGGTFYHLMIWKK